MATLVMTRTICCESYKCGSRCDICPNRPENRQAAKSCEEAMSQGGFGRRFRLPAPAGPQVPVSRLVQLDA
jgi:hypothetical protein